MVIYTKEILFNKLLEMNMLIMFIVQYAGLHKYMCMRMAFSMYGMHWLHMRMRPIAISSVHKMYVYLQNLNISFLELYKTLS